MALGLGMLDLASAILNGLSKFSALRPLVKLVHPDVLLMLRGSPAVLLGLLAPFCRRRAQPAG